MRPCRRFRQRAEGNRAAPPARRRAASPPSGAAQKAGTARQAAPSGTRSRPRCGGASGSRSTRRAARRAYTEAAPRRVPPRRRTAPDSRRAGASMRQARRLPARRRPPENCRRDRAGAQPQSRRQPDTPAPEGHGNSRRCRGQHGKQAALLRQEGRRRQPGECRGKQRRGKAGAQAGKQIITVQGTRLPPDRAVRRAARSPRRRPLPAHPAAPAAA